MRRTELIARLFLTVIGIDVATMPITYLTVITMNWPSDKNLFFWKTMLVLGIMVIWYVLFYQIWFRMGDWARWMAGEEQSPAVERIWVITGLRLVYLMYAIYVLAGNCGFIVDSIAFIIKGPRILSDMFRYRYVDKYFLVHFSIYLQYAVNFFLTILAVYFLAGAPHLLRWQLKQFYSDRAEPGN
ncbi:MAG: hypothetical protein JW947_07240 [Sedimentisphaerales bacterium]|nr:hypothetical protein [Sedimentisphaerales bacterium]